MKKHKAVLLEEDTHAKLTRLCEMHGRNLKQFTAQMIDYFERTTIDPTDENDTNVKGAIKELRKENNRVIGFIKQQEKTKLEPILDQMAVGYRTFKEQAGTLDKLDTFEEQFGKLLRNQVKLMDAIMDPRRDIYKNAINLFHDYLKEQEWGKAIGIGKYVKDPTELNNRYVDKFFGISDRRQ